VRLGRTYSAERITQAGNALVSPTIADYSTGFMGEEQGPAGTRWRWASQRATLTLTNSAAAAHVLVWSGTFTASPGASVRITSAGHTIYRRTLTSGHAPFRVRLTAPPGVTQVVVTSNGTNQAPPTDPRPLNLNVASPVVRDTALIVVP
jgi:hypothetical protein